MELVGHLARTVSAATCRARLTGAERVPLRGPALLMVNHTSIVDVAPVLAGLTRAGLWPSKPCGRPGCGADHGHVRFLVHELAMRHPLAGPLARQAGSIEVRSGRGAGAALQLALAALRRGEVVGIYPEGDVSAAVDGAPRGFRPGAARLALASGCQVVPVAHHDARRIGAGSVGETLRGAARSVRSRPPLSIVVGEPVTAAQLAGRSVAAATRVLQERLIATWTVAAAWEAQRRGAPVVRTSPAGSGADDLRTRDSTGEHPRGGRP